MFTRTDDIITDMKHERFSRWPEALIIMQSIIYGFGDPISKIAFEVKVRKHMELIIAVSCLFQVRSGFFSIFNTEVSLWHHLIPHPRPRGCI